MNPILLILLCGTGAETFEPALTTALRQTLGATVEVTVRAIATPPASENADAHGQRLGAAAVVTIELLDTSHRTANVRVHHLSAGWVYDHALTFASADPIDERARAIGNVIASRLLLALDGASTPPPTLDAQDSEFDSTEDVQSPPFSLEAYGVGGLSLGGEGSGFGGGVGLRRQIGSDWALRFGVRLRTGNVAVAQATSLALAAGGGIVRSLLGQPTAGLSLGLRVEVLVLYESLTHFSFDDPVPIRLGRWLPGAMTALEFGFPLGASSLLRASAGLEAAFGVTEVFTHFVKVGEIAPLRALVEVGFATRF